MVKRVSYNTDYCEMIHNTNSYAISCEFIHTPKALYNRTFDSQKLKIRRLFPASGSIIIGIICGILLLGILSAPGSMAQNVISVPAEFVRELHLPGAMNHFLRPARILTDNKAGEVYIADAGNDRILILDQNGMYKFEFSTSEQCGAPIDVAVDSSGHIFVLGATQSGEGIVEYDYNGIFLRRFVSDSLISRTSLGSIAFDSFDRLYATDATGRRILRFDDSGAIEMEFSPTADLSGNLLRDVSYGILTIFSDTIYLPVSSIGTVYCLDLEGNKIREIGFFGSKAGELNFPVAAAVMADRTILVLDKHRFDVSCYSPEGKFIGEFGGKGISPGWFYHPNWLAVDGSGLIYIGQIFNNKVQVCRLPARIRESRLQGPDGTKENEKSLNGSGDRTGQKLDKASRGQRPAISNINQHIGGIFHA